MTDKVKCEYCGSANFADSLACHTCGAPINDVEGGGQFVNGGYVYGLPENDFQYQIANRNNLLKKYGLNPPSMLDDETKKERFGSIWR